MLHPEVQPPGARHSLSRFGDMTSPAFEHVVGLDGLAVIVNKSNKFALSRTIQKGAGSADAVYGGSPG
jgi:hypothetical protein